MANVITLLCNTKYDRLNTKYKIYGIMTWIFFRSVIEWYPFETEKVESKYAGKEVKEKKHIFVETISEIYSFLMLFISC